VSDSARSAWRTRAARTALARTLAPRSNAAALASARACGYRQPMIVDGFMFFNELELLEIRLHELSAVVDHFILVEARETFTFKPKPLHFLENRARFKPFLDRIDHQIIDRFPQRANAWDAERTQRERIAHAFGSGDPDDLLVFSDLDEIPRAAALSHDMAADGPVSLEQQQYYLFLNCWLENQPALEKAKVARRRHLTESIYDIRQRQHPVVPNAGWHFSFLGGVSRNKYKMSAFAHEELNIGWYTSERNYLRALRAGRLHFDSRQHIRQVPFDESFPRHVLAHRDQYAHLIAPNDVIGTSRLDLALLLATHFVARNEIRVRRRLANLRDKWLGRLSGRPMRD
jgi:beta-1,4-mannosyl-glycoprotein beta-1,4-N-acetylglucosaminyltransferase